MRASWLLIALVPALASAEEAVFRHSTHLALTVETEPGRTRLDCVSCHATSAESGWTSARPGLNDHAPCDGCHASEYYVEPGSYCRVCHLAVDPTHKGSSPLLTYPRRRPDAQLIHRFSHKTHTGSCQSCHGLEAPASPYVTIPRHQECVSCHGAKEAPKMAECAGCHDREGHSTARAFASNDIHFTHAKHQTTRDGQPVPCERCHATVGVTEPPTVPQMRVCVVCHDDANETPDRVRIAKCTVCHIDTDVATAPVPADHTASMLPPTRASMGAGSPRLLTPAWPLPGLLASVTPLLALPLDAALAQNERLPPVRAPSGAVEPVLAPRESEVHAPEDHTPLFRRRHQAAASDPNAKCVYCHQGVSGSTRDACNDCHTTMRPRSHSLRFQGPRHGRLAAESQAACATCHEVDYCTSCHDIAPPSHFPLAAFTRNHTLRARTNPRACLTCHGFEATCERCHDIDGVPGGGAR